MSEQINEPIIDNTAELATLRKVNTELLQAKHTLKAKITELENNVVLLTEDRDNALIAVRAVTIDRPLKQLAEEMSQAPALWLREFLADYNVEADKEGSLTIQSKVDKTPIAFDDGKPVNVTASDVRKFLLSPNKAVSAERRRDFEAITIASRANGTVGAHFKPFTNSSEATKPVLHFGLK